MRNDAFFFLLVFVLLFVKDVKSDALVFPETLEVDVIFPRNGTFAPVDVFPIVLAFQNSRYSPLIDLQGLIFIRSLNISDHKTAAKTYSEAFMDFQTTNFFSSNPLYATDYI